MVQRAQQPAKDGEASHLIEFGDALRMLAQRDVTNAAIGILPGNFQRRSRGAKLDAVVGVHLRVGLFHLCQELDHLALGPASVIAVARVGEKGAVAAVCGV